MFQNVLVGVDGSANSRDAIALASRLAEPGARLTLAYVQRGARRPVHAAGAASEDLDDEPHALLERERAAAEVDAELVSLVASSPGRGLHDHAEEQQADLLVVGSCRRGRLGRVMLGDDTRASLNGAPCAVAVAARGTSEQSPRLAAVGVGYDGSDESEAALAAAREIAARHGAVLRALEVVSLPPYAFGGVAPPIPTDSIELLLDEARGRLATLENVEGRVVYGMIGDELASFGDELDLLVVGSRAYGPWKRLMLGSSANYLVGHARCSLLVLPRGARD